MLKSSACQSHKRRITVAALVEDQHDGFTRKGLRLVTNEPCAGPSTVTGVGPPPVRLAWLAALQGAVTVVELHRGAYLSAQVVDNLAKVNAFVARFTVLSLDTRAGEIADRVDAELAKQGQRIGPYDTLIAAVGLANDLTLVTHNTREFARVAGLRLVDWEATP